jgi:hypothetical protein
VETFRWLETEKHNTDQTIETEMRKETIDDDNDEVSIRMTEATARWNLLEDNRQVDLMILDDSDDSHTSPNWALVA